MFDEQTIQALKNNYQASQQAQVMGAKAPPKKKKSFLVDQISTATGILGGIGGSFITPIAGTAAGAAGGSALGEAIENAIMGDSLGKNVLKEGAIGGVLGAGPIRLAKVGMGAAKGVGKQSLEEALAVAGKQPLKSSISGRMTDTANKMLASQYGTIGKPVARATNPMKTVGELADLGITKPADAERIAKAITGTDGILNTQVMKAVGNAGIVPTRNVNKVLQDAIQSNGLVDKDAKSVLQVVKAQMDSLNKSGSTPNAVFGVMKNLEKRIANLEGKGGNYRMQTPERVDQANALRAVKNELQEQLYTTAGANKNLAAVMTPEVRGQLLSLHPNNSQWAKYVDEKIMTAPDVKSLRSAQSPFVRIGQILDEGDMNSFTTGGRLGNAISGGGTIPGMIASAATQVVKNPAARVASATLRGASTAVPAPTAKGIAARVGAGGVLLNGSGAETQPQSLEDILMQAGQGGVLGDQTTAEQPPEQTTPYGRENLLYDIQRDPQNADKYINYYQTMAEIYGDGTGSQMADMSQSSRNAMASSDNAINTVDQLTSLFNQAGGGSGRIGGTVKGLAASAGLDENARVYSNLANASVTQIAKALAGSGAGTVSDMDAKVIIAALPTLRDTPAEARAKFAALRQRLQTAKSNTMLYGGGGGSSLEDALMQQQGAY